MRGIEHADHRLAHGLDHILVTRKTRADQLDALVQACRDELLDEADAHAARQEDVDRIGLGFTDLCQFRRVIHLTEFGVDLLIHWQFVATLEAVERILARRVVGGDDHHLLVAAIRSHLACGLMERIVLVGKAKPVVIALRPGKLAGARVVRQIGNAGGKQRRADGQRNVRADRAGEEIDLVTLDVAADQLARLIRIAAHVSLQEFRGLATELAPQLLDRQIEAIARLGSQRREGPRQVVGDPHLYRRLRQGQRRQHQHGSNQLSEQTHWKSPIKYFASNTSRWYCLRQTMIPLESP